MEHALKLAAQREAQRNAVDREAQRVAAVNEAQRVAAVQESQRKAAEQAKSDAEKAELLADKIALKKRYDAFNAKMGNASTTVEDPNKRAREPDTDSLPAPKQAKSETDHTTIMSAFGVTFGAVAMGLAISPMIPAALTSAALALLVKAKLDAAKKK